MNKPEEINNFFEEVFSGSCINKIEKSKRIKNNNKSPIPTISDNLPKLLIIMS
jgi:hypothetical protein